MWVKISRTSARVGQPTPPIEGAEIVGSRETEWGELKEWAVEVETLGELVDGVGGEVIVSPISDYEQDDIDVDAAYSAEIYDDYRE